MQRRSCRKRNAKLSDGNQNFQKGGLIRRAWAIHSALRHGCKQQNNRLYRGQRHLSDSTGGELQRQLWQPQTKVNEVSHGCVEWLRKGQSLLSRKSHHAFPTNPSSNNPRKDDRVQRHQLQTNRSTQKTAIRLNPQLLQESRRPKLPRRPKANSAVNWERNPKETSTQRSAGKWAQEKSKNGEKQE